MAFSSGTYTLPGPALNTGDTVSATENNTLRNDMATAFNQTMLRDGTSTATGNLPMGTKKLTGLGAGTTAGDSVRYEQLPSPTNILAEASGGTGTSQVNGFKNRIINGAMMIDQRNAGASVTPADGTYTVDRWVCGVSQSSKFTVQQKNGVDSGASNYEAGSTPAGFKNSVKITSSSAYTSISTDYFLYRQNIEGFNISDLAWGTASAASVTLSFWVKSSLTGQFGGSFNNQGNNRSYPFSFTINSANTFELKTITIAGDQSGTWATDNGTGLRVNFDLGSGSNYLASAGSWAASSLIGATGDTKLVGTNGATFYITGVQLEKGSTATSFDYRPYGTELALCQRYYSKSYATETAPATSTTVNAVVWLTETTSSYTNRFITFPVTMRSTPTFTAYSPATGASGKMRNVDTATDISVNLKNSCIYSGGISVSTSNELNVHWTASAEL